MRAFPPRILHSTAVRGRAWQPRYRDLLQFPVAPQARQLAQPREKWATEALLRSRRHTASAAGTALHPRSKEWRVLQLSWGKIFRGCRSVRRGSRGWRIAPLTWCRTLKGLPRWPRSSLSSRVSLGGSHSKNWWNGFHFAVSTGHSSLYCEGQSHLLFSSPIRLSDCRIVDCSV